MRPRTLVFADPAKADLDAIYDYIAKSSPLTAERYVRRLVAGLDQHASLGLTGTPRDWIRPGLRLYVFGNHCVYFRIDDTHLTVSRIVHGARDIDAIVFDPDP